MSRKFRKSLREEVKSGEYRKPEDGCKIYVFAYGSEPLFTYEVDDDVVVTKKMAFNAINRILTGDGEPPKTNIKKVSFFRVA